MRSTYSDALNQLETGLARHFQLLREQRDGRTVFLIEHGLDAGQIAELQDLVGRNLRLVGLDPYGWTGAGLPLAVAVTEIGYGYRGTGTDFWPRVEAALNAEIAVSERAAVTRIFESLDRRFGIACPYTTDWTRQYGHIAWPIRNSLAPLEIHRPLAAALGQVLASSVSLRSDDELLSELRKIASGLWSRRLTDWLEDADLAVELSRRLILGENYETWLEPGMVLRVAEDLRSDPQARRDLRTARRHASRAGIPAVPDVPPARWLLAVSDGQPDRLLLRGPRLGERERRSVVGSFGPGAALRVAGRNTPTIPLESFLSGMVADLGQPPEEPMTIVLAGIDSLSSASSCEAILEAIQPETPRLFDWNPQGGLMEQVLRGSVVPPDTQMVWLGWSSESGPDKADELEGWTGPRFLVFRSDSVHSLLCLSEAGVQTGSPHAVEFGGGIGLVQGLRGITWYEGFPLLCRALTDKVRIEVDGQEQGDFLNTAGIAELNLSVGLHHLRIMAGGASNTYDLEILPAEDPLPFDCEITPADPHIEDLLADELLLVIGGPLALEDVRLELTLLADGEMLAEESLFLKFTPARLGARSATLQRLREAAFTAVPPAAAAVFELHARFQGLGEFRWRLPRRPQTYHFDPATGSWQTKEGSEAVGRRVATAGAPVPVAAAVSALLDVEELTLEIPDGDRDTSLVSGLLRAPAVLEIGKSTVSPQPVVVRAAEATVAGHGFLEICEAYLAWRCARVGDIFAESSRLAVATALETGIVTALCGTAWAQSEAMGRGFVGNAHDAFVTVCLKRQIATGSGFPSLAAEEQPLLREILTNRFRAAVPDLRSVILDDKVVEALDFSVLDSYEDLGTLREGLGKEPLEEFDIGFPEGEWRAAIDAAVEMAERPRFRPFILPSRRWQALSGTDYSTVSGDRLVEALSAVHLDVSRRAGEEWIGRRVLKSGLQLWLAPRELAATPSWRDDLLRLLSDRQTARAIRYAALRMRDEAHLSDSAHV